MTEFRTNIQPHANVRSLVLPMPRHNNFDLLRLIFASIVVLVHCHDLSAEPAFRWIPKILSSRAAVEGFFAMSGCLIVGSYDQTRSLERYFEKRARRILPAYWGALAFAIILGAVFSTLALQGFLLSADTWKHIVAHLAFVGFLHPSVPGLFVHNPLESAVNGALWTIKIEVVFYAIVPVIAILCRRLGNWQTLAAIFVLSVIYRSTCEHLHYYTLSKQLPGQLAFFAIGALVYFYYSWVSKNGLIVWFIAISSYIAYLLSDWFAFRALGVSLIVMGFGILMPYLGQVAKYGDFSYGIYVLHFPVIQILVAIGLFHWHPWLAMGLVVLIVAVLAFISWNFIEKPFLQRGGERRNPVGATNVPGHALVE